MTELAHQAIAHIQAQSTLRPSLGIVLGSGLGPLADHIEDATRIDYGALPGFMRSTVDGHSGTLVLGTLNGTPVACLSGRVHPYEGAKPEAVKTMIRTLKGLGCDTLIATNATGSLQPHIKPESLVLIHDHMNFQWQNPLIGPNDADWGERFFDMSEAYDPELREKFKTLAKELNIELHEGVYCAVLGPSFETPAEVKAFAQLGADVVGMSTVPEVIVARHCGMRVAVFSVVSNMATGLSDELITHEGTITHAAAAADRLVKLVSEYAKSHR